MITTASFFEIQSIVDVRQIDPHLVLGMHEVLVDGKPALSVRVFLPQATEIKVIDPKSKKTWNLCKVHSKGFFEAVITDKKKWFRYKLEVKNADGQVRTAYDPYSFTPAISELDLYLFREGTHYQLFNKLGAIPMEFEGVSGVLFGCWAPTAQRVSVIADFNSWDGRCNPMRNLHNSGVWEIFIPGLEDLEKYRFEIISHEGVSLEKADPYAHFAEILPNSASIVFSLDNFEWTDETWIKKRSDKNPLDLAMNIYELHLGSALKDGNTFINYNELGETLLPYLKALKYTHIELLPVSEYSYDPSFGYQITGHYAPSSRYGTPADFMSFVNSCHENGIGVILDWVPGNFSQSSSGLGSFDGTAVYEHGDPQRGEHFASGSYIFNYGRNEVKNFLIANALFWIEKYHIDGLRVDNLSSFLYLDYGKNQGEWIPNIFGGNENLEAIEFIKHVNSIIDKSFPDVLLIAEESTMWPDITAPVEMNGLGFNAKWNTRWVNDILHYMEIEPHNRKYHHSYLTFSMTSNYNEKYILPLSHNEVYTGKGSLLTKMPGTLDRKFANLKLLLGFMYGHPGKKLLFMGSEIAQLNEWSADREIDWFLLDYTPHAEFTLFVKELNNLYITEKACWHKDFDVSGFSWIDCDDSESGIISFYRRTNRKADALVFICNFSDISKPNYSLGAPYPGAYRELINSDDKKFGGSGITNETIITENIAMHNFPQTITLDIPPLTVVILKYFTT